MTTVRVALLHEFVYDEAGRLVSVIGPPVDIRGGFTGLITRDRDGQIVRQWETGQPLPVPTPAKETAS